MSALTTETGFKMTIFTIDLAFLSKVLSLRVFLIHLEQANETG